MDSRSLQVRHRLAGPPFGRARYRVVWSGDSHWFFTSGWNKILGINEMIWAGSMGEVVESDPGAFGHLDDFVEEDAEVWWMAHDGQMLAWITADGVVSIWPVDPSQGIWASCPPVAGSRRDEVGRWSLACRLEQIEGLPLALRVWGDGRVVVATDDGQVLLWDAAGRIAGRDLADCRAVLRAADPV